MNEDEERLCKTCAWWDKDKFTVSIATCCYDNKGRKTRAGAWCRNHSFTTGWEEAPKRMDSDYVQFLERLRKGPPLEDDEKEEDGCLREAIDHQRESDASQDVIKALKERIKEARWLLKAVIPAQSAGSNLGDAYWCHTREKWLENTDDE